MSRHRSGALRHTTLLAIMFLANDCLDCADVGLLPGLPSVVSGLVECVLGILGDTWRRRSLILGSGALFALALLLTALSQGFLALLTTCLLFYPALGAFVTLSKATLMDIEAARHQQNMARWTLAGSLGVILGSFALGAAARASLTWRKLFPLAAGVNGRYY